MLIRKYKTGDSKQIVWLINNTWRTAYSHIFSAEVFEERDKNASRKIEKFDDDLLINNSICFVAEEDNSIVGVLIGNLKSNIELFDKENIARLEVLYIDSKLKNKGIGTKLFNEFKNYLKLNEIKNFVVGVLEQNYNARIVYEKWGGKLTNYKENFMVLGKPYTEVFYKYHVNW